MIRQFLQKNVLIFILLIALLGYGLGAFRDYGLSWDEPLFYDYGESLGYAYNPANWLSPDFDLSKSYGSSGDDHKNRGPAYLVLARTPVGLLESLGVDSASAWHLVNFLTFLLGVYFVYRLSLRWMGEWAAFGAAALFSTQPLLWGHAFINPKDMPFLVFFTGALLFGFEMADAINDETKTVKRKMGSVALAAFFLGIATSIRILAPLAGIIAGIYAITQFAVRSKQASRPRLKPFILHLSAFILVTLFFMLASWPYLWESPLNRFIEVFAFMSENPTGLQVLFNGEVYRAYELPRRYLPVLLAITLTEPVWPLFLLGLAIRGVGDWKPLLRRAKSAQRRTEAHEGGTDFSASTPIEHWLLKTDYWLLITAFFLPFAYVILRQPPMYDGFRHFLFILPPVFVTCGLGMDMIFKWIEKAPRLARLRIWLRAGIILLLLLPGLLGAARLHPYEYAYYNSIVGGTGGAFRVYETDYWLTCYKEAVEQLNGYAPRPANLYVHREAYIAANYAAEGIVVRETRGNLNAIVSGDYILVNSRTNEDRKTFHDAPIVSEVGRDGATFCIIRQIP